MNRELDSNRLRGDAILHTYCVCMPLTCVRLNEIINGFFTLDFGELNKWPTTIKSKENHNSNNNNIYNPLCKQRTHQVLSTFVAQLSRLTHSLKQTSEYEETQYTQESKELK